MPTFIKTGFWKKAKKGFDYWLDLDNLIKNVHDNLSHIGIGKFIDGTDLNDAVYLEGNVGVKTADPLYDLDVNGIIRNDGIIIGTTEAPLNNATVFQKKEEDPLIGGELANFYREIERTSNPTNTGYYYGDYTKITNSSGDGSGTKGTFQELFKDSPGNHLVLYGTDDRMYVTGAGTTSFLVGYNNRVHVNGEENILVNGLMRGSSVDLRIDNPNADIIFAQGQHPTVDLRRGIVRGFNCIYLDVDITQANLGTTLQIEGDAAYLQGGGDEGIQEMSDHMEAKGYKLRFIHNLGNAESDFNGIINYLGAVTEYDTASDKALINKEWFNTKIYNFTPTSTADVSGNQNDLTFDDDFIYSKTSTGWKRAALTTF